MYIYMNMHMGLFSIMVAARSSKIALGFALAHTGVETHSHLEAFIYFIALARACAVLVLEQVLNLHENNKVRC